MVRDIKKDFGGEWTIQLSVGCYTLEVVNSSRILNNPDSIAHYITSIGREITQKVPNFKPCLKVNVTAETKAGLVTSSSSTEYTYSLDLIKLFLDKPLGEQPNYMLAGIAARNAINGDFNSALKLKQVLDSIGFKKDYIDFIDFVIAREKGLVTNIDQFVANLTDKEETGVLHLGAASFNMKSDLISTLKFIRYASVKNPENTYFLMKYGTICFNKKVYTEAASLFSSVIEQEPENLRALHSRAWANFKMG